MEETNSPVFLSLNESMKYKRKEMTEVRNFDYYFRQANLPKPTEELSNNGIYILVGIFIIFALLIIVMFLWSKPDIIKKDVLKEVNDPLNRIKTSNNV